MKSRINSGTYQLVSEHSILSAQRNDRVAALEKFLERKASHSKPEWKLEIDNIKQRLERRRINRGDELSEKDFEIYLEMKLDWLQQFYVTAKSRKRDEEPSQKHIDEWSEEILSDLEHEGSVYCPPLKLENRMDVAEQRVGVVEVTMKKILKQLDEINANLKDLGSKRKKNGGNGGGRGDEIVDDLDPPWKQVTMEAHRDEEPLDETMSEAPCLGGNLIIAKSGKHEDRRYFDRFSERSGNGDEESTEEQNCGDDHATVTGTAPAEENDATVVEEERLTRDGEESARDGEGCERMETAKESKGELVLDPVVFSLGQAQILVSKSDPFHIERGVLKEKTGKENKLFGFSWSQKKVDLTFNPMGQTHKFIITPTIFTNSGGLFQVEKEIDQKKLFGYDWAQNPDLNFEASASVIGFVGTPKMEVNFSAVVVSCSNNREATILYYLFKNTAKWRSFDPGGSVSVSSIIWSLCFKLWDPG